jgi:hypothetical protein|tara:strand:+ start:69 stop:758 length:690 start_codon:yes stop_codon:yes gene_type:complete
MANSENKEDGPLGGSLSNPNNGPLVGSYLNQLYLAVDGGVWSWGSSRWISHTSIKGDSGDKGPVGEQGPIGVQGNPGLKGLSGPIGFQGLMGSQGLRGIPGAAGALLSIPMLITKRNRLIVDSAIDDAFIVIDDTLSRYNIRGIHASYGAKYSSVSISYKLIKVSANGVELEVMRYDHLSNTKSTNHGLLKSIALNKGDSIYLMPTNFLSLKESGARGYSITLQLKQKI